MSFQLFIYYCAVAGGWAAFLAALIVAGLGKVDGYAKAALTGLFLGALVAAGIGLVDSVLNDKGAARLLRTGLCAVLGAVAGVTGASVGQFLSGFHVPLLVGWVLVGALVGASIGAFDVLRGGRAAALRKVGNGAVGGVVGGLLGGLPFSLSLDEQYPTSGLAVSLSILGALIGLSIGLAQVILKEAWLKVDEGFRAGRELMLSKPETTIGRGEACDLGLFGDNTIQRVHARIVRRDDRYLLEHAGDGGELFVNDRPVAGQPVELRAGDRIRVGKSVLSFGERQKRK